MKVGLLVQRFPGGGAEYYVEEIATRLDKDGYDVTVITSENDKSDDSKYNFKIIRLSSSIKIGEYFIWKGLEKILEQEKFEIIHSNTYGYYHSDKVARLKTKLGYKLVFTSHGFHGTELHNLKKQKIINKTSKFDFIREFYDKKIGKNTMLEADHVIALSNKEKFFYLEIGVDNSQITVLPPGIRDNFFDERFESKNIDGVPNIITIGELSWIKSKSLAVKAMPLILKKFPKAKLFVIGKDKDQLNELKSLVTELDLKQHVFFLGSVSDEELLSYMRSSHLLVHTSLAEGLSTILLESMAVGIPFVTTPAGGNGELAQNSQAGLVTPFEDEKALSDNIEKLFEGNMAVMKNNGKKYAQNLSWNKIYPQILQIYQDLVKSK